MNLVLFRKTFKNNWLLLLIFFGVLTMYTTIMIAMFDPEDMEALNAMVEMFPEELLKAMGFSDVTDLTSYVASWLYGLLMFAFPMVYAIILGYRLVAKTVDNGSMAYLLSTPNSRIKIIVTKGLYALLSIFVLFLAIFLLGITYSEIIHPGLLDIRNYLKINVTTMLVNMVVVMISFFFSSFFNDPRYALGFGTGLPITFLLLNMLSGTSSDLEFLKNFTIYGYDPVKIVNGQSTLWLNLLFISLILSLFLGSVVSFNRKQLPI
jgi:ABC-2 type transport system permease protein